ncbi:MAG TPA: HEAT repeat domain-containing protein [Gemmataceae bacterium]|nr:HEAT repeat domain-containing protein [Gemmataceae bacterium]
MNRVKLLTQLPEDELRARLTDKDAETRFVAAWAISEKKLPWYKELIGMLTDKESAVRMSARRSLIILAFDILNPGWDEQQAAIAAGKKPAKPVKTPKSVDFGPSPDVGKSGQVSAQKKWTQWFEKNGDKVSSKSESDPKSSTSTKKP